MSEERMKHEKVAWLIERETDDGIKYIAFLEQGMDWTLDANAALAFADKQGAECFGNAYGIIEGMQAAAIEHCWPEPADLKRGE